MSVGSASAGAAADGQGGWLRPVRLSLAAAPEHRAVTDEPVLGVYRITKDGRRQTGVLADVLVHAAGREAMLGHEQTRVAGEHALVSSLDEVERLAGPVVLAHRESASLSALLSGLAQGAPAAVWRQDGAVHEAWLVRGERLATLQSACAMLGPLYIIDGHHRVAAALRRRAGESGRASDRLLAAVFPCGELTVHAYHRVIDVSAGPDAARLLDHLAQRGELTPVADLDAARPVDPADFGLGLAGRWHRLRLAHPPEAGGTPHTAVELLDARILGPVLRIADSRTDPRIEFVSDVEPAQLLNERASQADRVCFLVNPLTIDDVLAVADAGRALPPKSTWFDPKPISGVLWPVREAITSAR